MKRKPKPRRKKRKSIVSQDYRLDPYYLLVESGKRSLYDARRKPIVMQVPIVAVDRTLSMMAVEDWRSTTQRLKHIYETNPIRHR